MGTRFSRDQSREINRLAAGRDFGEGQAQQQAAAPAAGKPLPVGTVVSTLPAGCNPKVVGGVEYRVCGSDFYRAAFQGSTLVYVTAQP